MLFAYEKKEREKNNNSNQNEQNHYLLLHSIYHCKQNKKEQTTLEVEIWIDHTLLLLQILSFHLSPIKIQKH